MKKNLLLLNLFLLGFNILCMAQSKNHFTDGSRWVYFTGESQEPGMFLFHNFIELNYINGDYIENGKTYKKLYTKTANIEIWTMPYYHTDTTYSNSGPQYLRYDTV